MPRETIRKRLVTTVAKPDWVSDGAGVRIKRVIASRNLEHIDPFLLLDEFKSDNADDYIAGFPMHPHRGIETVTYMLAGQIKHEDSLGNAGVIGPGDVQWMTAGKGIIHSEMPEQKDGLMWGFQLWVNLPRNKKLTEPRYQEIQSGDIPTIRANGGAIVRVIAGELEGTTGPVKEVSASPIYLDISLSANSQFKHPISPGRSVVAYVFEGAAQFQGDEVTTLEVGPSELAEFSDGNYVEIETGEKEVRLLLLAGTPFDEPIVRHGPFAMNTWQEIETAFKDYNQGRFV